MTQAAQSGVPQSVPGEPQIRQRQIQGEYLIEGVSVQREADVEQAQSAGRRERCQRFRILESGQPGEHKPFQGQPGERSEVVDVRAAAADVQMDEPCLVRQEAQITQDAVVAYDEFGQLVRQQPLAYVVRVDVPDDLEHGAAAEVAQGAQLVGGVRADVQVVRWQMGDDVGRVTPGVEPVGGPGELGPYGQRRMRTEAGQDRERRVRADE